eukprot:8103291-Pyramimonas_sp.AAC.1
MHISNDDSTGYNKASKIKTTVGVTTGLFLGTAFSTTRDVISQLGITHVLGIGPDSLVALENDSPVVRKMTPTTSTSDGCQYEYEDEGVHYMVLAVEDAPETSLLNYLHGCFNFIDSALKVSHHCCVSSLRLHPP